MQRDKEAHPEIEAIGLKKEPFLKEEDAVSGKTRDRTQEK